MTEKTKIKVYVQQKLTRDEEMKAEDKIARAKQGLILSQTSESALYNTILLNLEFKMTYDAIVPGAGIPTMGTNGRQVLWHPQAVLDWTLPQIVGALAHEAGHIIFKTLWRQGVRDHKLWNWASDMVINNCLDLQGFDLPMREDILLDHKYDNKTADEIYDIFYERIAKKKCPICGGSQGGKKGKKQEGGGNGDDDEKSGGKEKGEGQGEGEKEPQEDGDGSGGGGEEEDDSPCSCNHGSCCPARSGFTELDESEADILIQQAIQAAKSQGNIPAGMERLIEKAAEVRADFRKYLNPFLRSATSRDDITWTQPSRRSRALGMYLPGREIISSGAVGIAVDTSGSMGDVELEEAAGVISAISMQLKLTKLIIVYADAEVSKVDTFTREELPFTFDKFKPKGGGGTDFRPAIEYLEKEKVDAIVYFTDGYGTYPTGCIKPVLWVYTTTYGDPPFGMKTFMPKVATR